MGAAHPCYGQQPTWASIYLLKIAPYPKIDTIDTIDTKNRHDCRKIDTNFKKNRHAKSKDRHDRHEKIDTLL